VAVAIWLWLAGGLLVALLVAAVGLALPAAPAGSELAPLERRTIESDFDQPFVECTTHAGVTSCRDSDLSAGGR
jgi:hypothetical protein